MALSLTFAAGNRLRASDLASMVTAINFNDTAKIFRGRQTVAQSFTNGTFTPVTFDTEDIDTEGGHSTSSNTSRYVGKVAGWYEVSGGVAWAFNATGNRLAQFAMNGTVINGGSVMAAAVPAVFGTWAAARTEYVLLNGTTDYIEILAWQSSGGNLNTSVGAQEQSSMNIKLIKAT